MERGTVKLFNERGFGFISRTGKRDIFVHYSNVVGDGYRILHAGELVEFEVAETERGLQAVNVRVIVDDLELAPSAAVEE